MSNSHYSRRLVLALLAGAVAAALSACGQSGHPAAGSELPSVQALTVQTRPFEQTSELPGRLEAVRVAQVRARVAGIVLKRHFKEGADVKAGEVLFTIDPAPFEMALKRAQGDLAKAEAAAFEAEALVKRYRPLVQSEAVSRQEFDTADAAARSTRAGVQSAQAEVATARLNLGYATVRAPISGRIGRALVTEGALVGQNEATALADIQQLDPIYADFQQPAAQVTRLREDIARGQLQRQQQTSLQLALDGSDRLREGRLLFSDITVDKGTGQLSLRGSFPNPDGVLLPGMYVRIKISQGLHPEAVLIPQRAVKLGLDGKPQVLVVDGEGVVRDRTVVTGAMAGSEWHILSGLKAGEKVVVGAGKVQSGAKVRLTAYQPAPHQQPDEAVASAGRAASSAE
ncbi:MAG: Multidrug efflux pump subunit AcrA [Herbaspirillum frisingense]|uniref:Multidrug efflux pump subunit AcrA n=1 Tax=Herbaspirillum frisingense TaxID=92645 RepID=A0A7V8FV16_9BURK|nr:MAG: Multidrug efflux pump subunit AcrA [Herbaspirillum frisingense]